MKLDEAIRVLAEEISRFLNLPLERISIDGYEVDGEFSINGAIDLNYLEIGFSALVNLQGDGGIYFDMRPTGAVKIEGDYDIKAWEFEISNWKILDRYVSQL